MAAAAALLLGACGTGTEEPAADSTPAPQPSVSSSMETGDDSDKGGSEPSKEPAPGVAGDLPDVEVVDVASGEEVALRSVASGQRHVLLWAWAPHCTICAGEAPGVEAFAGENDDVVDVIGLGTQDDLDLAESFVDTYGVRTPVMVWDGSFESWRELGITSQPTWVLLSPQGDELARWSGGLPEDEILGEIGA